MISRCVTQILFHRPAVARVLPVHLYCPLLALLCPVMMWASCEAGGTVGRDLISTREFSHPFLPLFHPTFLPLFNSLLKKQSQMGFRKLPALLPKALAEWLSPGPGPWVLSSWFFCCLVSILFLLNMLDVKVINKEFIWRGL